MIKKKMYQGTFFIAAALAKFVLLAVPVAVLADSSSITITGPSSYSVTVPDNSSGDANAASGVIDVITGMNGIPQIPGFNLSLTSDIAVTNSPGGPTVSLLDLTLNLYALAPATGGGRLQLLLAPRTSRSRQRALVRF